MILLLMGVVCVALLSAALVVVMLNERDKEVNTQIEISLPTNEEFDDFDGESTDDGDFPFVGMSQNSTDGTITVDWHFPSRVALSTYKIEIQAKDQVWYETSECDGTKEEVAAANFCKVNLQRLQTSPYFLSVGDTVKARVFIIDDEGWMTLEPT